MTNDPSRSPSENGSSSRRVRTGLLSAALIVLVPCVLLLLLTRCGGNAPRTGWLFGGGETVSGDTDGSSDAGAENTDADTGTGSGKDSGNGSGNAAGDRPAAEAPASAPAAPTQAPAASPAPTAAPAAVDRGEDDPDYETHPYVDDTIAHYNVTNTPYTLPMPLDGMVACILRDCAESDGRRTVTADYAAWEWVGSDVPTLTYRNDSPRAYTLPVADDVLLSIFAPDRSGGPVWDERDELSGFYAPSDWQTLCGCYAQVTDPGTAWAQPTYFFLHFNEAGQVDCIWQDALFFTNN